MKNARTIRTLLAQPVAWMVYLPSIDTQHLYYSQEDMGYVDDVTNHADAEVTPLYEMAAPKAEVAPAGECPPLPTPDSYLFQHQETGVTQYVDSQQVEWGFEKNNPRLQRIGGAFTEAQMRAYVDTDRVMRAQADSRPAPVLTSETGGDWTQPTTVALRLGDAMQLLCGGKRPPDDMVQQWLDNTSESLQEFAASNGPAWAQGIGLIDAALVMVDQPTEITAIDNPDRDHEHRTARATRVKIAVAMSEAGTVRLSVAGSNWIQEERKHQQMLAEIRADKQLWSVRYITTSVPYPMSIEDQP